MNVKKLNAWWQLQPQELKQELVKCGLPDGFWQQTDGSTKKGIHKLCLSREGGQPIFVPRLLSYLHGERNEKNIINEIIQE